MNEKEAMLKILNTAITLQYVGVDMDAPNTFDLGTNGIVKFSVPEYFDDKFKESIKGSVAENWDFSNTDNFMKNIKEVILDIAIDYAATDDLFEESDRELLKGFIKFYAKVRKGETWTEEMAKTKSEKLIEQIKEAASWSQV